MSHVRSRAHDRAHRHHLRRIRLCRPLHRPAHGEGGLARARRRAAPERGELCATLRRCRAGGADPGEYPRRRIDGEGHSGCDGGGELRRHSGRGQQAEIRRRASRGRRAHRAAGRGGGGGAAGPYLRHRRECGERQRIRPHQGRGRGGCAGGLPLSDDPAPVDHLRERGSVLQPLRGDGEDQPGYPDGRRGHPVPAGFRR